MKTRFAPLLCCLLFVVGAMLSVTNAGADSINILEFSLDAGFRADQIDWNIVGNLGGQDVAVLSELNFKNLNIWQVGARGKLAVANNDVDYRTYIRGAVDYGWLTNGTARDSDYHGNNRTDEISRSLSDLTGNNVVDASIGLGFEKDYWQGRCTLGWLGGYAYSEQNLRLTNGRQLTPLTASIAGLNSSYVSKWHGPFAGLDLELRPWRHFSLLGSAEYHWVDYKAKADWNLRDDLAHPVSFRQQANNGNGLVFTLRGRYLFTNNWGLDLSFAYHDFSAQDGTDSTILADGTITTDTLNKVSWKSYTTNLGLTHSF